MLSLDRLFLPGDGGGKASVFDFSRHGLKLYDMKKAPMTSLRVDTDTSLHICTDKEQTARLGWPGADLRDSGSLTTSVWANVSNCQAVASITLNPPGAARPCCSYELRIEGCEVIVRGPGDHTPVRMASLHPNTKAHLVEPSPGLQQRKLLETLRLALHTEEIF